MESAKLATWANVEVRRCIHLLAKQLVSGLAAGTSNEILPFLEKCLENIFESVRRLESLGGVGISLSWCASTPLTPLLTSFLQVQGAA